LKQIYTVKIFLTVVLYTFPKYENSARAVSGEAKHHLMKRVLLTSLLLVMTACSSSTPQEKLTKGLKTILSWSATAQMVGQTWQQGTVPQQYAQQTLEKSQQEINKEVQDLSAPPALRQSLQQLQQTIQHMTLVIKQGDKAAIDAPLRQLATEQQQLGTFAKEGEQS
jgi:hypothetical protein